ncbi:MAG: alpha/beta hydrolase [Lachnospiraceae bacterium]|nr:alpha/beta hydrolase [Lachnospiraceae bacterium]
MHIHEFGNTQNPVILLLPGTCCFWKGNFGQVIEPLSRNFLVSVVAYTGFDENDTEDFHTVTEEVEQIEAYVTQHYTGSIRAAYGCSLGGSLVGLLAARRNIHMQYGILGSTDLDQAGAFKAKLMATIIGKVIYPFIHNGYYTSKFMQKRYERQMANPDPYNRAFVGITGRDKYDMSFISKESIKNQFASDLITPLPLQIDNGETQIHIFYAKKMGEKYLSRYQKHFKDPIIHEQDMRHEEFLGVYPQEWCTLVNQICL